MSHRQKVIRIAYGVNKSSSDAGIVDELTVFRRPVRPAASDSYGVATVAASRAGHT